MKEKSHLAGRPVYVVDGCRTPFLKARDVGPFTGSDLAVWAGRELFQKLELDPSVIDELVIGSAMPGPDEANIARVVSLRLGCGDKVPAFTVMRNCASGMQALDNAALDIASGRANLVLAGGTDAMSHAPILYNLKMASWLGKMMGARTFGQRLGALAKFRPSYLAPVIGLLRGLTDPIVGLNMGQTAEKIAYRFGISREDMDAFALRSHQLAAQAWAEGRMVEVSPIIDRKGRLYPKDDGIRADVTAEKLANLKPAFDKTFGMVTAGNSSQITDGATMLLLASAEAVKKYNLPILGQIKDVEWAALDPAFMGLGPVHASYPILKRHGLDASDFDVWEINEAFAAQVLGCLRAMDDAQYCQDAFGLKAPIGAPDIDIVNQDGGAIALGHPIGASGARIVLHALELLKQKSQRKAMAAICIGGGQGGAMYLERVDGVSA